MNTHEGLHKLVVNKKTVGTTDTRHFIVLLYIVGFDTTVPDQERHCLSYVYPLLNRCKMIRQDSDTYRLFPFINLIVDRGNQTLVNTNYEGKAEAAIRALERDDFVFVHVEASDEAGHDGDLELKLKTIEYLDQRLIAPIYNKVETWAEPVCIAVLPDHLTPVEQRIHVGQPVPFLFWYRGIEPDGVQQYDEVSCVSGSYGLLRLNEFMQALMKIE